MAQPPCWIADPNWVRFASAGSSAAVNVTAASTASRESRLRWASATCRPGPTPIRASLANSGASSAGGGFCAIAALIALSTSMLDRDAGTMASLGPVAPVGSSEYCFINAMADCWSAMLPAKVRPSINMLAYGTTTVCASGTLTWGPSAQVMAYLPGP